MRGAARGRGRQPSPALVYGIGTILSVAGPAGETGLHYPRGQPRSLVRRVRSGDDVERAPLAHAEQCLVELL